MKIRKYLTSLSVASLLAFSGTQAMAITSGELDVNLKYPNVVALSGLMKNENGEWRRAGSCTGSLLAVNKENFVFLTAAHCAELWLALTAQLGADNYVLAVSFDLDNSLQHVNNYVRGGVTMFNPSWFNKGAYNTSDTALVVFSKKAKNSFNETIEKRWGKIKGALTPVNIVPANYMTQLLANVPKENLSDFITVGYGTADMLTTGGGAVNTGGPALNDETYPDRYIADKHKFIQLNGAEYMTFQQNTSAGNNGNCYGDSGGPTYYPDPVYGEIQVTVTSTGDVNCVATHVGGRLDTPAAQQLLACGRNHVTPEDMRACVNKIK